MAELKFDFEKMADGFIKTAEKKGMFVGWWIPVSDRLPEIQQDVLLSLRSLDVEVGFRGNTEPYYYCHGDYIEPQNVLAWMPLPQPFEPQESEVQE